MPEKIVEVPGMGNVSFPDTMSDDDIGTAIKTHLSRSQNRGGGPAPGIPSVIPPALQGPPVQHPGFFSSAGTALANFPGSVLHSLTSTPITEAAEDIRSIPASRWNAPHNSGERNIFKPSVKPLPSTSEAMLPPGISTDYSPQLPEIAGGVTGNLAGTAALSALTEGLESPRLRGYAGGIVKALPKALKHSAMTGTGAAIAHSVPILGHALEGAAALQALPDLAAGASAGASGKLWTGPGLRTLRDMVFPPMSEDLGGPSGSFGTGVQSGFGTQPHQVTPINPRSLPEGINPIVSQMSPEQVQAALHPTFGPTANATTPNAGFVPGQYNTPSIQPLPFANRSSLPEGINPPKPVHITTADELAKVELPDWLKPKSSTAKTAVAQAPAYPPIYDDIAKGGQYKEPYSKLTPEQQAGIRRIADKISPPVTPIQPFGNPIPPQGLNPTLPNLGETPAASPLPPIGNHIVYPENVHKQLHAAGPEVAITHGSNASAKDLAVANHFHDAGITPEMLDRATDEELNKVYTALGYKKLGSDYAPGKRVGRDAATGRAHLRNVLSELFAQSRKANAATEATR